MILRIWVDKSINKIRILTDDPSVKFLLEKTQEETKYIPWERRWGTLKTTIRIYDKVKKEQGTWNFILGLGWAGYIIGMFNKYMNPDDYRNLLNDAIYSDEVRTFPFPNLRDYQNTDVLHMLKYRTGLYSVFTSYGKTQVIATLAEYFSGLGKKVLLITPGKKAQDELVKRCISLFGYDPKKPDNDKGGCVRFIITSGLMNRKDVKDPVTLTKLEAEWKSYDVVLVDEVEYTVGSDSGEFLYNRLTGASHFYGFSGTADKSQGECISFANGLNDTVLRNKVLVSHFGPSIVFRMPIKQRIDNIKVLTRTIENIKFDESDFDDKGNVYNNIMTRMWTDPDVCKLVVKLIMRYPKLFIPINNLVSILNTWIEDYLKYKFRILLICGKGYVYYDLDGKESLIKLPEACEKVANDELDHILSTSAGYRALDLPNLESIFLPASNIAGVVLQSIGRVARGKHMNIISLETMSGRPVPVYTKAAKKREDLMKSFYKYCDIIDSTIYDMNL